MLKERPAEADGAQESGHGGSGQRLSGHRRSMTIVSRVLIGAASGFAMLAAAHAADMGDKAEPVQFMKICTLDGHSYYYIPSNDACTKNGLSLTIGTDDRRGKSLMSLPSAGAPRLGQAGDRQGEAWSDPLLSLRTDQSWGHGALVGGVYANASYTGDGSTLGGPALGGLNGAKDKAGFFVALEGEVKVPIFGAGDRIGAGVQFNQGGATGFGGGLNLPTPDQFGAGNGAAPGWDGGSGIELTKAWSVQAGYDHQWSPGLNTSLFAGYSKVIYGADPTSYLAGAVCGSAAGGAAAPAGANCKSSWGNVGAGLRTSWAPASGLTLSVQTMYNYGSGITGAGNVFGAAPVAGPADSFNFANQGVWSSYLRINRTFNTAD
jgi:Porin subfamily